MPWRGLMQHVRAGARGEKGARELRAKDRTPTSHTVFSKLWPGIVSTRRCLKIWKGWQMGSPAPGRLSTLSPIFTYSTGQGNRSCWSYTYDLLQGIGLHDCGAG